MARRCELSGKGVLVGNNVSHANNKTKRRYISNLQITRLYSEVLKGFVTFKICVNTLRTIDKVGGVDNFFAKFSPEKMSQNAIKTRKTILDKRQEASTIVA
jgi:large subunit ribosomal protein L28